MPSQAERHHFHCLDSCDFECSKSCDVFDFFNFSACRPTSLIPHLQLILFDSDELSPPAMPHLIHRSHYSQVFYVVAAACYRCCQILILEKNAWQNPENPEAPQLRNIATPPPTPPTS